MPSGPPFPSGPSEQIESGQTILSLQAARAVAAIAVVFFHANLATVTKGGNLPSLISAVCEFGFLGVDLFFVLSGFIIHQINLTAQFSGEWLIDFSFRRVLRIFLPYWPVAIAIAGSTMFLGIAPNEKPWNWLVTLTPLPFDGLPTLGVAWTLRHELIFYFVYAIGFGFGRPIWSVSAWAAAIVLVRMMGLQSNYVLDPINLEFLFGLLACELLNKRPGWHPLLLCMSGAAFVAFAMQGDALNARILFGLAVAGLLPALVATERSRSLRIPRPLVFVGGASYSIYLIHNPVMVLLTRFKFAPAALFVACVVAGVALGVAYHLLWERPVLRALRARLAGMTMAISTSTMAEKAADQSSST